jgi:hypothetical protein
MNTLLETVQDTALLFFPDVGELKFAPDLKSKEKKFVGGRQYRTGQLSLVLNPAGDKLTIEWKGYLNKSASYFRIFRVVGFPITTNNIASPSPQ